MSRVAAYAGLLLALLLPLATHAADARDPRLTVEGWTAASALGGPDDAALVWGRNAECKRDPCLLALLLVLDISGSTGTRILLEKKGNGLARWIALRTGAPSVSRLDLQVRYARALLGEFDPRFTRSGLVTFGGYKSTRAQFAELRVPLTSKLALVDAGMEEARAGGAKGKSNLAGGIDMGLAHVDAFAPLKGETRRVVALFSDGIPTLPHGNRKLDLEAAVTSARAAQDLHVAIDTYSLADAEPDEHTTGALREISESSGGQTFLIGHPSTFDGYVPSSGALGSRVVSVTIDGEGAEPVSTLDGTFVGLVPLRAGLPVEVVSRTDGGREINLTQPLDAELRTETAQIPEIVKSLAERLLSPPNVAAPP